MLPGLAAVAIQEARYVARVIERSLRGQRPEPFRYRDRRTMAVVGRSFAIDKLPWLELWGHPGSLAWACSTCSTSWSSRTAS